MEVERNNGFLSYFQGFVFDSQSQQIGAESIVHAAVGKYKYAKNTQVGHISI